MPRPTTLRSLRHEVRAPHRAGAHDPAGRRAAELVRQRARRHPRPGTRGRTRAGGRPQPARSGLHVALRRRRRRARPRRRTRRSSSPGSRRWDASCPSGRSSSPPTTSTCGPCRGTPSVSSPCSASPSRAGRRCAGWPTRRSSCAPPGAPASTRRPPSSCATPPTSRRRRRAPTFPAIFKPVASLAFKRRFGRPVLVVPSRDELIEVYRRVDDCGTLMLQEIVPGGDDELYTVGSYLDAASRPLAVFTGRKLRQHPRTLRDQPLRRERVAPRPRRRGRAPARPSCASTASRRSSSSATLATAATSSWRSTRATGSGTRSPPRCGVNLSLAAYRDAVGEPSVEPAAERRRALDPDPQGHRRQPPRDPPRRAHCRVVAGLAARHARRRRARPRRPAARPRQHGPLVAPRVAASAARRREARREEVEL